MICPFPRQIIQSHNNPSLCLDHNGEQAEVERVYEDLQDLLEITPPKDILFIIGEWNVKIESKEMPEVTGKFGLEVKIEAGQRLTEFCQENTLVTANILFPKHKR